MQKKQAYFVGALLIFGSAMWASLYVQDVKMVIVMLAVPSLLAGYIYAAELTQYIWGMLLGVTAYIGMESVIYGPIYKVTWLVYGAGFAASVACAIVGFFIYSLKARKQPMVIDR